jgi:spore germination protein KB
MQPETEHITPFQFIFSVICFLQSSALLSSFFTPITHQDSWLVGLFGIVAATPLLLVYIGIMKRFPDKTLIEVCLHVFGRLGGVIVSVLFIWFFLSLTALNTNDMSMLVRQTILVETPSFVTSLLCVILSAYALYRGIVVVTRYAPVFALFSYLLTIFSILMTIKIMDTNNFLPILTQPPESYIQGTNIVLSIPYGELVAFLMVTPSIRKGKRSVGTCLMAGFLAGSVTIIAVAARDTAVLGRVGALFSSPSFETLRMANLGTLNRMEVLFVIVLIVLLFFKIMFLYYVTVMAIAQLIGMKSPNPLVLMTGGLVVAYSVFVYPDAQTHANSGREIVPLLWLLFEFLLPALILVVARIRGLIKTPAQKEVPST